MYPNVFSFPPGKCLPDVCYIFHIVINLVLDLQLEKYEIARDVILSGLHVDHFR
jgi:hypothetical protein